MVNMFATTKVQFGIYTVFEKKEMPNSW